MKTSPNSREERSLVAQIAFRVAVAAASAALTAALLFGIALNRAFSQAYAPLSGTENFAALVLAGAYSIPLLFGVVILLPQNKKWARSLGGLLVFLAAPAYLGVLLALGYVQTFSDEFFWILLWMTVAIFYWFRLRPLEVRPRDAASRAAEGER